MACGRCGGGGGNSQSIRRSRQALGPRQQVRLPFPEITPAQIAGIAPATPQETQQNSPNAMTSERRRIESIRRQAIRRSLGIG